MKIALTELLKEVGVAYEMSDIKKQSALEGYEWFYSLISTSLETNGPLILGFNWGASKGEIYSPQTKIEKCDFAKEDVGSLSRIFPFCEKYFGDDFLSKVSQSNYCFFRSNKESQIKDSDIRLCEPIFEKLLVVVQPSSIICFSTQLRNYLIRGNRLIDLTSEEITFLRGTSKVTYTAMKGALESGKKIYFLPHPNYPIKSEARARAWEFCFE